MGAGGKSLLLLLLLWEQTPYHQQQQREFSGDSGPDCGELLGEGETHHGSLP